MSIKKIYFMAGMPRSGSTLLSSILNQNPNFNSGPNSSVVNMMTSISNLKNQEMYEAYPVEKSLETILRSIILNYYYYHKEPICIDKNRGWTGYMDMIFKYITPNPKIICPVRDIKSILTSFISLLRKNNYNPDNFIDKNLQGDKTDDNRCRYLLGPGIVGQSILNMIDVMEKYPNNILLVHYDDLINNVPETMKKIYHFLDEEYFEHSLDIKQSFNINDEKVFKLKGMHKIRPKIKKISNNPENILSKFILNECDTNEVIKKYEKLKNMY